MTGGNIKNHYLHLAFILPSALSHNTSTPAHIHKHDIQGLFLTATTKSPLSLDIYFQQAESPR